MDELGALLTLQDQMSGPAASASSALQRLEAQIKASKQALTGMSSAAVPAAAGVTKIGDAAKEAAAAQKASANATKGMLDAVTAGGGPLGGLIGRVRMFTAATEKMGGGSALAVAGVAALVVVILALAAALVVGIVKLVAFAIATADAARTQQLNLEAMVGSAAGASQLAMQMENLRKSTGASVDEQMAFVKQLKAAKVPADQMSVALRAMAVASAGGGADAVAEVVKQLKGGKTAAQAAAAAQAKWGALAAKKMLGLSNQAEKFSGDIKALFSGINIEGFLQALQKLLSLFDTNTAAGRAMKAILTGILQPLIDGAAAAIPYVVSGFKQLLIWSLKAYIAIKQFASSPLGQALIMGVTILAAIFGVLVAVVTVCAAVLVGIFVGGIAIVVGIVAAVIGAIVALIGWFVSLGSSIIDSIGSIDLASIGSDMISGLVNGIISAGGAVLSAITGVVGGAISAAKAALGLGSPSKVFAKFGSWTAEGFAGGVDSGAGAANAATEALGTGQPAGGKAAGKSPPVLNFNFKESYTSSQQSEIESVMRDVCEALT